MDYYDPPLERIVAFDIRKVPPEHRRGSSGDDRDLWKKYFALQRKATDGDLAALARADRLFNAMKATKEWGVSIAFTLRWFNLDPTTLEDIR